MLSLLNVSITSVNMKQFSTARLRGKRYKGDKIKTDTILIDANSFLYRSFFALPPLSVDGTKINAVFGFLKYIMKITEEYEYKYIGVCFDTKKNFRKDISQNYKKNRASYPV